MPIIEADHVTKEFQLGELESFKTAMRNRWRRLRGQPVEHRPLFKALDDITFSVEPGEVLGIIGHNGAGKSTLLKLLAGISKPSSGRITTHGRIAPLIEVGAGFVGQLTGRENVYLNGAILGMSKKEIDRKFDEIVDFSELEEFIDTPVKRYSSGMRVKLAFSVATSIETKILIVDEVLAVGDIAFQRKCLNRMEDFIRRDGRTVLIVGHNIRQLERICSRMLLLKHGRIVCDGTPGEASKLFFEETTLRPEHADRPGLEKPHVDTGEIELRALEIVDPAFHASGVPRCTLFADLHVRLHLWAREAHSNAEINLGLHNPEMIFVTKTSTSLVRQPVNLAKGNNTVDVFFPRLALSPSTYGIGFAVYDWTRRPMWAGNRLLWLTVEATPDDVPVLPPSSLSYLPARWEIHQGTDEHLEPPVLERVV